MTPEILTEIITQLSIRPDFTICHPQHPNFVPSELAVKCIQDNSIELQQKFLTQHLQSYLIGMYFTQVYRPSMVESLIFANRAEIFQEEMHQANTGQGYYEPDWLVEDTNADGLIAVAKNGLRLHISDQYVYCPEGRPLPGDLLPVAMPKNIWLADRYVAISNYGRPHTPPFTNIYWNYDPQTALAAVNRLTTTLNQLTIPFELRIETNLQKYHRLEPLILILASSDYHLAEPILQQVFQNCPTRKGTPIFTKQIAEGLAVAETTSLAEDFGGKYCRFIAKIIASCTDKNSHISLDCVLQSLRNSRINPYQTYLVGDINIYTNWEK
jgi:hypothetical protein